MFHDGFKVTSVECFVANFDLFSCEYKNFTFILLYTEFYTNKKPK